MIPLDELDEAWRIATPGARLDAVRAAALRLKARLHAGGSAVSVRTYDLISLPYPTRYGLTDALSTLQAYLLITNRMQLVIVATPEGRRTLLVNPSDWRRNEVTPFFRRKIDQYGRFVSERILSRRHAEVPERLAEAGLRGDEIDFITYDHLHTQDLRRVMLEWCPRAKLLVMRPERELFRPLHPLQRDWYVAEALDGIPEDRIVCLDRDVLLGDGVALVRTPGHTIGNHTIVLATDDGIWTISENGVSCDNYAPALSRLPGVAAHAKAAGLEVILNGNTREGSLDQYTSMVLEKTLADPCRDGSGWVQHFCSSELTAFPLFPGLGPTYAHRAIQHGPAPR